MVGGDYNQADNAGLMDKPTITGDAIKHYQRLASGRPAVIFAASIAHSQHIVEQFRASGISAAHLDGTTDTVLRDQIIADWREGRIKVVSNVGLFGEGFDLPGIKCVILLRPTASLGLYRQMVGRGLRPDIGGNKCIILDHAGNVMRHGLPCDEHEWSLDSKKRSKKDAKEKAIPIKQCSNCYHIHKPAPECPLCGYIHPVKQREIREVAGELSEVDVTLLRRERRMQQGSCTDEASLIKLAQERGYKNPVWWARNVLKGRASGRGKYTMKRTVIAD
jgi:superfamily II DNA or RNA helicase